MYIHIFVCPFVRNQGIASVATAPISVAAKVIRNNTNTNASTDTNTITNT